MFFVLLVSLAGQFRGSMVYEVFRGVEVGVFRMVSRAML